MSEALVLSFSQIRAADLPAVGGKGANLGEMSAAGLPVPGGFCVTTRAYRAALEALPGAGALLDDLDRLRPDDVEGAGQLGARLRAAFESQPLPELVRDAVLSAWRAAGGEEGLWAVRSSATAEDLPGASFAGQQDTYLNIRGEAALLDRVRACFGSLFTDRAILYRAKNGFGHRAVALSVVVQRMVAAEAAGIAFTADPLSGNRQIISIDAGFGLGEALVSGLVNADLYRVDRRGGQILERRIGDKAMAILPLPGGGTERRELPPERRRAQALDDGRIRDLAALCARVEALFGCPQDIEWALANGELLLLQSRPITSLFPLPEPAESGKGLRVHVSFGHVQVMTDPMSPMGRSVWAHIIPIAPKTPGLGPSSWVKSAGGRLFIDVTPLLRHPVGGRLLRLMGRNAEALVGQALSEVMARPVSPEQRAAPLPDRDLLRLFGFVFPKLFRAIFIADVEEFRVSAAAHLEARLDALGRLSAAGQGAERVRNIRLALAGLLMSVLPKVAGIVSALPARALLNRIMAGRVERAELEAITRGLDGNVTTEMDLAVGDLADAAREHPALLEALRAGQISGLESVEGGPEFLAVFRAFLERYGMRGPGEIDLARPRYRDRPELILQVVVGNVRTAERGAHRRHFAGLAQQGEAAADQIAARAPRGLGWLVRRLTRVYRRNFALREHPKFMLVRALDRVGAALRELGAQLVAEGRLQAADEVFFLDLEELEAALGDPAIALQARVDARREELRRFAHLSPPRVLTSDGESVVGRHDHAGLPAGALAGTGASAGVVEGVARVVLDPHGQVLNAGEILIAPFTDPGWTPLFLNAKGLVMEVGGLMTHGSVVAREYGIPAVVCVPEATRKICTGDRVRVDGDRGFVQVLSGQSG